MTTPDSEVAEIDDVSFRALEFLEGLTEARDGFRAPLSVEGLPLSDEPFTPMAICEGETDRELAIWFAIDYELNAVAPERSLQDVVAVCLQELQAALPELAGFTFDVRLMHRRRPEAAAQEEEE